MPAQTCHLQDPKGGNWTNLPDEWKAQWEKEIAETLPAFDPDLTPTDYVGWLSECFRKQKGVVGSTLAEHRARYEGKRIVEGLPAPIMVDGKRKIVRPKGLNSDDYSDFNEIGSAFERKSCRVKTRLIGETSAKLLPAVDLVDFATQWMSKNRL